MSGLDAKSICSRKARILVNIEFSFYYLSELRADYSVILIRLVRSVCYLRLKRSFTMVKYVLALVISTTIMGCKNEIAEPVSDASAVAERDAQVELSRDFPSGFLIEYIQHSKGKNFT